MIEEIEAAKKSGRYMLVLWYIEDGKIEMRRTTHNFPVGDFVEATRMLDHDLKGEIDKGKLTP